MLTKRQNLYIKFVKRPIGFLGALVAVIVTSPILGGAMVAFNGKK